MREYRVDLADLRPSIEVAEIGKILALILAEHGIPTTHVVSQDAFAALSPNVRQHFRAVPLPPEEAQPVVEQAPPERMKAPLPPCSQCGKDRGGGWCARKGIDRSQCYAQLRATFMAIKMPKRAEEILPYRPPGEE